MQEMSWYDWVGTWGTEDDPPGRFVSGEDVITNKAQRWFVRLGARKK